MSNEQSEQRQYIQPQGLPTPAQPYTPVVRVGNTIYVAGQVPYDADRNIVGVGDPARQAEQCWKNIETCLKAAGASLGDIVKVVCMFSDIRNAEHEIAVRRRVLPGDRYPVASIMEAKLGLPAILMEIDVIAVLS
jgi:enamine deaminase RidA (YjgF/YER057c/UK114 family)